MRRKQCVLVTAVEFLSCSVIFSCMSTRTGATSPTSSAKQVNHFTYHSTSTCDPVLLSLFHGR
ncbi:hypothetical protein PR001_g25467 [Phytophthora rubi]|uniref:RxLR effector protein n=2 Tax=Phytophthora TaxID=4783 RepID=A0A6A3I244_9STRA|nr:hypothetical protein PR001_g25467 [Phytophthora rubi]KAE9288004.1 hypothetical protein PF008_g26259 [Phytophthora fragariae]